MRERIYRWLDISTATSILLLLPLLVGATTYTFTQTDWSGGITANTATHTDDQTGWTEYSATSTSLRVANSGADLQIATSTTSVTQTNDGSTNTGFNLTGAAFSTTEVVGSGSAASIRLETSAGSDIVTSEGNQYTSIAVDSNDKAHLSFIMDRAGSNNDLYHATNATNTDPWSIYKVADNIAEGNTSIAVDSNDFEHISFNRNADLGYATNASGSWVVETADAGASNSGPRSSLALDSINKVHISYYDATNEDLNYATNASGSWATTSVDGIGTGRVGNGTAIGVDSNDKVHIAYYSTDGADLRYATNASGSWATSTVDATGSVGQYPSIAIDSSNFIYISYFYGNDNALIYSTNRSGSWVREIVEDGVGATFAQNNSIALDSAGNPHIVYYSSNPDLDLHYATSTAGSGTWATSTLASAGSVGTHNAIAIDSNDSYHVSVYDTSSGILYLTDVVSYSSPGTFTSGPMSLGVGALGWDTLSWSATLNGGTTTLNARTDSDGDFSDAPAWGTCTASSTSGFALSTTGCVNNDHQYIQYQATLETPDTSTTPILNDVTIGYVTYVTSQTLTSSVFDTESETTAINSISWIENATLPDDTSIVIELRTAEEVADITSGTWYEFNSVTVNCSKDVDTGTVTCPSSALPTVLKNVSDDNYFQYRVTLSTDDGTATPTFSELSVGYVPDTGVGPTVNTQDVSSPTSSSVTLNGNIIGTGGTNVTVRGFAYSTDSAMVSGVSTTTDTSGQPFGLGTFTHALTGLTCDTTYYVRAYATNTAGTGFGFDETFNLSCETGGGGSGPRVRSEGDGDPAPPPPPAPDPTPGPVEEDPFTLPVFDHTEDDRRFDPAKIPSDTPPELPPEDPPVISGPLYPLAGFSGSLVNSVVSPIQAVVEATQEVVVERVAPLAAPIGLTVAVGALAATTIPSTAGFFLSLLRLWQLLLSSLGIKKKKPWGVVYDSVTKRPLDPATIVLTDEYGTKVHTSYTDLEGRYGFLATPGTYRLEVNKTNYIFPSERLKGRTSDEVYNNLYFGGPLTLAEGGALIHNIPLDPANLDWKEFATQNSKTFRFHSNTARTISFLTTWLFRLGFLAALYFLYTTLSLYDLAIVLVYALVGVLRLLGFGPRPYGYIKDKKTGDPLAFALVTIHPVDTQEAPIKTTTDNLGRYYALVPDGRYTIEIAKKEPDESYTPVFTSRTIDVTKGVVKEGLRV